MAAFPPLAVDTAEGPISVSVSDGYNVSIPKPFVLVVSKEGKALPIANLIGETKGFEVGYFQVEGALGDAQDTTEVTILDSWRPAVKRASLLITDDPVTWFKARSLGMPILYYGALEHVMIGLHELLSGGFELRKRPWWKVWGK